MSAFLLDAAGRRLPLAAVTFDVTGTLIHSPRLGEIYAEVLGRHGLEVSPGEAARLVRLVWRELDCGVERGWDRFGTAPGGARGFWTRLLGRLAEHLEAPAPDPFAVAELFHRFGAPEAWEIYPEVRSVLAQLRQRGLRLAVLSNWDERLPGLLAALELAELFESLVVSQLEGCEKPDPRLFLTAARRLGCAPAACLHVGDSRRHDLEGAQAAGMQALWLDRSNGAGDLADLHALLPRIVSGRG